VTRRRCNGFVVGVWILSLFHERRIDAPASVARPRIVQDEDIKAEIRKSLAQSASAFNCGDVETIHGYYAPGAVVLPPNSPAVQGMHAIPPTLGVAPGGRVL